MRKAPALLALALLAGCQAHMIETHGDALRLTKKGLEQPDKGGVVRYLSNGLGPMKRARRADAERQMRRFCGGDYAITAEGPRSEFGAAMPIPKGSLELDEYRYIAFECQRPAHISE